MDKHSAHWKGYILLWAPKCDVKLSWETSMEGLQKGKVSVHTVLQSNFHMNYKPKILQTE